MPAFSIEAASSRFNLPRHTREQIRGLMMDLDLDATQVIIRAIAELWQREIGEPDRDLAAEVDELRARLDALTGSTMKTYTYTEIALTDLRALDLRDEVQPGATAYRITIYQDGRALPETADALYVDGRLGISWGAESTWADVAGVEDGIEMWLNDAAAWAAAN